MIEYGYKCWYEIGDFVKINVGLKMSEELSFEKSYKIENTIGTYICIIDDLGNLSNYPYYWFKLDPVYVRNKNIDNILS